MPISFVRLRIAGFKSFAEPAIVEILPGLTGVVGPNGCGKSNVVEALRWAMGENSARSLRGGEMDDVIFAGTAARASRNLAEVMLSLEDAAGLAPPPFHQQADLQISRKIERGMGSTYRVNGKEVRARDVQTLFADLASGARSSAMVSQGRVSAIVNARPDERRAVLEEAAGITGLHARRHEAEVKLRAAETNLTRADDLRGQLDAQLGGLKRQARQAARYRNLSGLVREAESELLALQRARVAAGRDAAAASLFAAESAVAAGTTASAAASAAAADAEAALPALRETEAASRTALERARLSREQIGAEEGRVRGQLAAAADRLAQIGRDLAHAEQSSAQAQAADARLQSEAERLAAEAADHPARLEAARAAAAEAAEASRAAESAATAAAERAAALAARSQAAGQALSQAEARHRRLSDQLARLSADWRQADAATIDPARLEQAAAEHAQAETDAGDARVRMDAAEQGRTAAQAAALRARDAQSRAEAARTKLAAEVQALAEVLAVKDGERWPPMIDAIHAPEGLEAAIGAVLGEDLAAAANRDAPRHWRDLPALETVPMPGQRLSDLVQAPAALHRALSVIALVESEQDGDAAQPGLLTGQVLVSRAGAVWRWDGYTIRAGTPTAAAVRLKQRNRLHGLREQLAVAAAAASDARTIRAEADTQDRAAAAEEQGARGARRDAEARLERARSAVTALRARANEAASRLAGLDEQLARLAPEAEDAGAALRQTREQSAALPDSAALRSEVERARAALSAARAADVAAHRLADGLSREGQVRDGRCLVIGAERQDWRIRAEDAAGRVIDLSARAKAAELEHAQLAAEPDRIAARAREAIDALEGAETAHRRAAEALSTAVARAADADRAARRADQALAAAREALVRAEGVKQQANAAWGTVAERILERLGASPALPDPPADLSPEAEDKSRRKLERLAREREEMGPVNLRAELEAAEIETAIEAIERERAELGTAIAKLRGSIGHLNREGRERLGAVFTQVDRHFQALFTRMFGGGRAHLAMVGSDDPLQAGLEIYAQPPGKKLSALSLLSGGEQALTALSLIFAVFRCNPAPVCVLDEVDAPLDDANVERFCALLDDMVAETGTRFLVVTHHHLTMARMDRLYGVTMQERGVSRCCRWT